MRWAVPQAKVLNSLETEDSMPDPGGRAVPREGIGREGLIRLSLHHDGYPAA